MWELFYTIVVILLYQDFFFMAFFYRTSIPICSYHPLIPISYVILNVSLWCFFSLFLIPSLPLILTFGFPISYVILNVSLWCDLKLLNLLLWWGIWFSWCHVSKIWTENRLTEEVFSDFPIDGNVFSPDFFEKYLTVFLVECIFFLENPKIVKLIC
jgi:hypothetical protein